MRTREGVGLLRKGGRLTLPKRLLHGLDWLQNGGVLVLREFGRVQLAPFDPYRDALVGARATLDRAAEVGAPSAGEELRAFDDKYRPITIPENGRISLDEDVMLHLHGLRKGEGVLVVRRTSQLDLISAIHRDELLEDVEDLVPEDD